MRKLVVAAVACACLLAVAAVAYAQSSQPSQAGTLTADFSLGNPNVGTPRNPQGETLRLTVNQAPPPGQAQSKTSARLLIKTGRLVQLRGLRRWAARNRCDSRRADQQKSNRVCPRGSRVGRVNVTAKAANGTITQILRGTTHVIKPRGGSAAQGVAGIGFWITSTSPVAIAQFLPGKVNFRTGVVDVSIPANLQQPVAGVKSAIERLVATIGGRDRRGGPLLVSTGCPRSRQLPFQFTSVADDGSRLSDTDTFRCR
jgi:hypothetical protein